MTASTDTNLAAGAPAQASGQSDMADLQATAGGELAGPAGTPLLGTGTAQPLEALCPYQPRPAFPPDALREGIHAGRVVLRLMLDDEGRVIASEVLEAAPRGYFEAASRAAVQRWRCLPPALSGERSLRAPIHFEAN